jgi:hypothetical protein
MSERKILTIRNFATGDEQIVIINSEQQKIFDYLESETEVLKELQKKCDITIFVTEVDSITD